jgi:hypothetical protein
MFASSFLGFSAQRPAATGSWVPVSNISRVDGVLAGVTAISADLALVAGAANGGPGYGVFRLDGKTGALTQTLVRDQKTSMIMGVGSRIYSKNLKPVYSLHVN